jgi:hypothetical protein
MPKLFFGFQSLVDCTPLSFFKRQFAMYEEYKTIMLINGWDSVDSFDAFDITLADMAKVVTKGMTVNVLCASFYTIKPLHTIGFKVAVRVIRE